MPLWKVCTSLGLYVCACGKYHMNILPSWVVNSSAEDMSRALPASLLLCSGLESCLWTSAGEGKGLTRGCGKAKVKRAEMRWSFAIGIVRMGRMISLFCGKMFQESASWKWHLLFMPVGICVCGFMKSYHFCLWRRLMGCSVAIKGGRAGLCQKKLACSCIVMWVASTYISPQKGEEKMLEAEYQCWGLTLPQQTLPSLC